MDTLVERAILTFHGIAKALIMKSKKKDPADGGDHPNESRGAAADSVQKEEPTRTLSENEYRDWVQDRISAKLLIRITGFLSVLGIAGIIGFGTLAVNFIDSQITLKLPVIKTDILKDLAPTVKGEVASTLLNITDLEEKLKKTAQDVVKMEVSQERIEGLAKEEVKRLVDRETRPERIEELVRTAIIAPKQLDFIVRAVSEEIRLSDGIQTVLLEQIRPMVLDEKADVNQRASALHMVLIFESQEAELRSLLKDVLASGNDFGTEFYKVALKSFKPADDTHIDAQVLENVMDLCTTRPEMTSATRQAVFSFASRFSAEHAKSLITRIERPNISPIAARFLLDCLIQLQGDAVVSALVDMATAEKSELSDLGWLGLSLLERDRAIGFEARDAALQRLWPVVQNSVLPADADLLTPSELRNDLEIWFLDVFSGTLRRGC